MGLEQLSSAAWLLLLCTTLLSRSAWADVVTLSASKDNTAYEEDGTVSNGAGRHIFTGQTNDSFWRRAFIAFDIASAVPAGSTIDQVTLTLYLNRTKTQSLLVELHRVTADWGEGASVGSGEEGSGAPAEPGDLTWTFRFYASDTWSSPGGDFLGSPSASTLVSNQNNFYAWSSSQMAADVQGWLDDPATNYGWALTAPSSGVKETKRFARRAGRTPCRCPPVRWCASLRASTTSPATSPTIATSSSTRITR